MAFVGSNSNSYKVSENGANTGGGAFYIRSGCKLSMTSVKVINNYAGTYGYGTVMVSDGGIFEMDGSLSCLPYDSSDTYNKDNYVFLSFAGYSGGVYKNGKIHFLDTSTVHISTNKLRIKRYSADSLYDNYKNIPMLTAKTKTILATWLLRYELVNSVPSGASSHRFETDTSLDSTETSAYYRKY